MKKTLILFIHGLGGSKETWGEFPTIMSRDNAIDTNRYDVVFHEYDTELLSLKSALPLIGTMGKFLEIPFVGSMTTGLSSALAELPTINELARRLHSKIDFGSYAPYERIYIVAHSMGGLIAQKYLVDRLNQHEPLKVKKLILYDVPNHGSSLATLATIYNHPQIKQLAKNSEFITELNRRSEFHAIDQEVETHYVVCSKGSVVDTASATAGYKKNTHELDRTHTSIVKPIDSEDESYLIFQKLLFTQKKAHAFHEPTMGCLPTPIVTPIYRIEVRTYEGVYVHEIAHFPLTIGRGNDQTIRIPSDPLADKNGIHRIHDTPHQRNTVSRHHLEILGTTPQGDALRVRSSGKYGSTLEGKPFRGEIDVSLNQTLTLGIDSPAVEVTITLKGEV